MTIDKDLESFKEIRKEVKFDDAVKVADEEFNKLVKAKLNFSGKK